VLYGDADHRIGEGARAVLTAADLGVTPQAGSLFGWSVAVGTIDQDSCADVVVGSPGDDLPEPDAGAVHVVYGSLDGLNAGATSQYMSQLDVGGTIEAGDRFGSTVAVGENLGQDTSVVVAGTPGEDVGSAADAGAVNVVNFSDTIPVQPRQITQNTPGIPDAVEAGDQFGAAVALGADMLRDDEGWELLAGAPGESVGSRAAAGSVTVVAEVQGFPPDTWQAARYTQDSPGVGGAAESGDRFGARVAVGNRNIFTPGSLRRVAVGVPGEDIGADDDAGAVNLLTASGAGLQGLTFLSQDTPGVRNASEPGDRFGASVAVMPGRTQRLAVGAPFEDLGSVTDAGMVQLFDFDDVATDTALSQDSPGAAGVVHAGSLYGSPLVALEGGSERAFLVGNPRHATGAMHVVSVDGGFTSRSWQPGIGGVPGAATRFGWSVGGHDDLG
jgi:hypothetical protein